MVQFIGSLIVGGILGAIAGAIVGRRRNARMGMFLQIIAGLVGSWVGVSLFGAWGPAIVGFHIFPAILGTIIVVFVVGLIIELMRRNK